MYNRNIDRTKKERMNVINASVAGSAEQTEQAA